MRETIHGHLKDVTVCNAIALRGHLTWYIFLAPSGKVKLLSFQVGYCLYMDSVVTEMRHKMNSDVSVPTYSIILKILPNVTTNIGHTLLFSVQSSLLPSNLRLKLNSLTSLKSLSRFVSIDLHGLMLAL
jgi:hypothetical protein